MRKEKYQAVNTDSVTSTRCLYTSLYLDIYQQCTQYTLSVHFTVPRYILVKIVYPVHVVCTHHCTQIYISTMYPVHVVCTNHCTQIYICTVYPEHVVCTHHCTQIYISTVYQEHVVCTNHCTYVYLETVRNLIESSTRFVRI